MAVDQQEEEDEEILAIYWLPQPTDSVHWLPIDLSSVWACPGGGGCWAGNQCVFCGRGSR